MLDACQHVDFERKKMAKSTGNNILPREILTGENTILSCIGSSIFHVTSTTEAFLIFLMMQ
jgi:cysteinyl-tRNA synthetase